RLNQTLVRGIDWLSFGCSGLLTMLNSAVTETRLLPVLCVWWLFLWKLEGCGKERVDLVLGCIASQRGSFYDEDLDGCRRWDKQDEHASCF
ncbi:UNVERIFIED_CONTAM: hypothetical protein Sindi_1553000, partial [Sesamum indicum]